MAKRKVVQIEVATSTSVDGTVDTDLFALCNDSTVWINELNGNGLWRKIKLVPGTIGDKDDE